MKYLLFILVTATLLSPAQEIERFDKRQSDIGFAVKTLNEVSDLNIIYTKAAAEADSPPLVLKKIHSLQILKVICSIANVAYSYDAALGIYTIKTLAEYRDQIPYSDKEITKQFKVDPLNLDILGGGLEDLYGERLYLSQGYEVVQENLKESSLDSGSNNNGNNSNGNNSNGNNSNGNNSNGNNSNGNNSNGNNSNGNNSGRRTRRESSKRFELDFTVPMNVELEELIKNSDVKTRQSAIAKYINRIRRDEPEISVTLNQEHSHLIVRSVDLNALEEIGAYIVLNNKKVPQVLLEVKILELTINDDFKSVFDVSITDPLSNTATNLTSTGEDFLGLFPGGILGNDGQTITRGSATLAYEYLGQKVAARIELLKRDNLVETLATPLLIATNNREGEIQIVNNDVFIDNFEFQDARLDPNGNVIQTARLLTTFSQDDVGLTLRIKPQIHDDNTVTLTVYQEDSTKITNGAKIPIAINGVIEDRFIDIKSEKSIHSTVTAKDKTVIAIGGLVRTENVSNVSKVPILGDIPLLGYFFTSENTENVKKEIVLLITPHIMYNTKESVDKSKDVMKKISDHKFHEGGQKAIDSKNSHLKEYKDPKLNTIRDFVKDPNGTIKGE
jgi:type II secretory pathway component GspD/PulD (secretin)